jgi:P4 family phage/plasmid primase-like protien
MYKNRVYKDEELLDLESSSKLSRLTDTMSVSEKNNNSITLKDYIENKKLKFGDKTLTHQWWDDDENINFKINDDEYDEFLQVYYKELKREKRILHVMEQPKEIGPLCLDFDLKQISPQRTICTDDIMHIISIVNDIVHKYYSFKDKKVLESYVFMKKEPFFNKKKLLYSDGFHLQYPNLILNSTDRFLIYHESRKEIIRQDLFSNIYSILVNVNNLKAKDSDTQSDIEDSESENEKNNYYLLDEKEKEKINDEIFDPCVIIRNKWFMYYSGKNIDGETNVYHLQYIFDYNLDEIEDIPGTKELVKLFSIRKPTNESNLIHPKETDEYLNIVETVKAKYLKKKQPQLDVNKLFKENDNQEKIQSNTNDKIVNLINQNNYKYSNQDDIQHAKKLIKLLSANRAKPYEEWICVGWALYNISPSLLPEFLEFSKKAGKKYDEAGCIKIWEDCSRRYDSSGYTIASLVRWAKEDNLDGYKKLLREKINSMLDKGDMVDFDIACILKEIYKHEYKCSSISKGVWWQFDNHRWNRIECAHTFSIKMSTEIAQEFATLQYDLMKLAVLEVGQKADILNKRCKDIMNLVFNLKKGAYKDRIIKECSYLFYEKDFESKLDQNNYLIGFTNGVYDLRNKNNTSDKNGKIKYEPYGFRKGCPDDLVGKTVGYDYIEYKMTDKIIIDIEKFIESIQPEEDMKSYLMAYCSSFLEGSNKDQKFMIWTGCHAIDQGIMMSDGSIKKVQDIKLGDKLMGDDSKPRNVLRLIRGNDTMCEIIPYKGDSFKVNLDHILSLMATDTMSYCWSKNENRYKLTWQELINGIPTKKCKNFPVKYEGKLLYKKSTIYYDDKHTAEKAINEFKKQLLESNKIIKKGDIIDISVRDYMKYSKLFGENNYYLFKKGVEYPEQELKLDPYLIGYWLGDGISSKSAIVTAEKEIIDYFTNGIKDYNLKLYFEREYHYRISSGIKKKDSNYFLTCLKNYNLIKNKHIPNEFMFNSRENRLKLLAGIIDSDGHYQREMKQYEITFKSEKLFDDVLFLVRSLGFTAYKYKRTAKCGNTGKVGNYFRMNITGIDMDKIPSLLERKQCRETERRKNTNITGFKIKILKDKEDYYGFQVDGNNRYLMDDFTVTHNCGSNGKGSLIDLLDNAFNGTNEGYFGTLPPTVLTQKRGSSSAATPELADKFGKRVITLQEPEGDDKIHVGFMKNITGQDKIEARPLYGDPFQYTPQFKLLLACNHLPNIPSDDNGTWRRIRVIDFGIKFTSNPQNPNERKADPKLRDIMKRWHQAFMWLLINQYYPIYVENDGMDNLEPERVKSATDKYKSESNIIMEFFNEELEAKPDSHLPMSYVYNQFNEWYKNSYNDKKPFPKRKLKEYFDNNNFKVVSSDEGPIIKGIGFRDPKMNINELDD